MNNEMTSLLSKVMANGVINYCIQYYLIENENRFYVKWLDVYVLLLCDTH